MAINVVCNTTKIISIDEFVEHVHTQVDVRDPDSIIEAAPMLQALANDRELVVSRLNQQIKQLFQHRAVSSGQVVFLAQGKEFYVRANIWPSSADVAGGRIYQDQFSYNVAHDHNYGFLTANYFGPGYTTDIYEYDNEKVQGYVGEHVDLRFLGRTLFSAHNVMYYRASKDVHTQFPPDDLSITLNLMIATPEVQLTDQYFFDLDSCEVIAYPPELDGSRRISMLKMAGLCGNTDTRQLLSDIAAKHPCRRTRLHAFEQLATLAPSEAGQIWAAAAKDRELLVSNSARKKLSAINS